MTKSNALLTAVLATFAIAAFAGNSLLARAALADGAIEAGAYSAIRLAAGAIVLLPFLGAKPTRADLPGAAALTVYVAGFSVAYLSLEAGIGAVVLFGFVQATILGAGVWRGERLLISGWFGVVIALAGMVWLIAPWEAARIGPSALMPSLLMAAAGIAWGAYTLIGRGSASLAGGATGSTARNFLIASILVLPMLLLDSDLPSQQGVVLAIISGAVTSGLGYVLWYKVTPRLGLATVASVQLATPIAAAFGGALFLAEPLTARLAIGGGLIIGGIVLTLIKTKV
ncbi:DMT family transporter [uncultured Erythrobacter sp.]|uniref:DMT family transporter n=1 Tax=uncultured Erythrobacter sp. TaxID=263913 RepID=UPI002601C94A|nr:DMT family transporter [uncultured Erythrobacter sp.]